MLGSAKLLRSCVGLVLLAGCGSDGKLETHPVTGTVTFADGKPLSGGIVTFRSLDHKVSASGVITRDGKCQMGTYEPGDGAVAGRHGVAIVGPTIEGDLDDPDNFPLVKIAPKYNRPSTSELDFTVTPGKSNEFTFQVSPP